MTVSISSQANFNFSSTKLIAPLTRERQPLFGDLVVTAIQMKVVGKLSARAIARSLGVDAHKLRAALRPLGHVFSKEKLTKAQKAHVCCRYQFVTSYEVLAPEFDVSCETIRKCLHDCGVPMHPTNHLSVTDWRQVFADYAARITPADIALSLGVDRNTVTRAIEKAGIYLRGHRDGVHSTYTLDRAAFRRDDEHVQYWLGFVMADGCVYVSGTLSLALALIDKEHIAKLAEFLKSNAKIIEYEGNKTSFRPGKIYAKLCVNSKDLIDDLALLGVVPRKTGKEKFLAFERSRHAWRGAIDGDGSLGVRKTGALWLTLSGSKDLCDQFRVFVLTLTPTRAMVRDAKRSIHTFGVSGSIAQAVITELYRDCTISLDRKHARILHLAKQK